MQAQSPDRAVRNPAFAQVYEHYAPVVDSFIKMRTHPNIILAELTGSDTWMRVYQKIDQWEDRGIPFSSWLHRVANNALIDRIRELKRQPLERSFDKEPELAETLPAPSPLGIDSEENQRIAEAMKRLTREQREVVELRFFGDLNIKEVAEATGNTEDGVKKLQARGLRNLQLGLIQDDTTEEMVPEIVAEPEKEVPFIKPKTTPPVWIYRPDLDQHEEARKTAPKITLPAPEPIETPKPASRVWVYKPELDQFPDVTPAQTSKETKIKSQPRKLKKLHQKNRGDLTPAELALALVLFPDPDQYPIVTKIKDAVELSGIPKGNIVNARTRLADKLSMQESPKDLMAKPRKRALLERLSTIDLYQHTTPEQRDQIMWFQMDKSQLEANAAKRSETSS